MNRIGFWWDIKTANIEYYDIQYAAERTKCQEHNKKRPFLKYYVVEGGKIRLAHPVYLIKNQFYSYYTNF